MLNYVQVVTTPTADTPGTTILLHFDNQRYVFGHAAEGTQRAFVQRKVGLNKLDNIFLSGTVNWQGAGGLLGMILTVADVLAAAKEQTDMNNATKPNKKSSTRAIQPRLKIHAGKNLSHLLATSRRFVFRKGLPIEPHEIRFDSRNVSGEVDSSKPDWVDGNINVWYMPIESGQKESPVASPRKRSHDEFRERDTAAPPGSRDETSYKFAKSIVGEMFNSDWTPDALVETTLHKAQLPAKIFVRKDKGHLEQYRGPLPGRGVQVPDIPVLIRKPWPGATISKLPRTEPSKQSLCYIVKGHDRRGKFDPVTAQRLGVAKPDYKRLVNLESVKGKDGNLVTPDMVLGKTVAGSGFAVVDIPDVSYVDGLVNRPEWDDTQIMSGIHVVFWILGRHVADDTRLQAFMQKTSSLKHIVTSADTCPNMIALESAATQAYKLRCVDSDRFPLPSHNNELSLAGTVPTDAPLYETGRIGKTVQFAPRYQHQDDKIVPFPDIEELARSTLDQKVLEMAAQARSRISDPDFLAKLEKVEADIPNRDAEVISLGTGSALPSKYRNVSATLVRVPGYGNYLFDAGENTLGQLRRVFGDELPSVLRDLKVIWISHLHADHHLGTTSVLKAWHEETMKSDPSARLAVSSHFHMIEWLREYADVEDFGFDRLLPIPFSRPSSDRIHDPYVFGDEDAKYFGLAQIQPCLVSHCYGSLATVFTLPSGFKIAYSGDCRPSEAFVQIGQGATLLIHESTFDDELLGDAKAKKHSTMSEAINVGRQMGARRILLTHFSQRYQKIPIMEEDFEIKPDAKRDEVILVAFDYMRVKLGEFRKAQAFLPAIQKMLEEATE
ncbi:beta-lactamase-like protein [Xylaria arbuscula]|nr:beta-lactamase-like protein [Xylaria arbuscula]